MCDRNRFHWLALLSGLAAAWLVLVAGVAAATPARTRAFISPYSYEWFIRAELLQARGEHAAAAEAYRMALAGADEDPYVLARLAEALQAAGEPAEAQAALRSALQIDPRSEAAWLVRARIATDGGATAQALEAYERAEAAAPTAAEAPLALAQLLQRLGHPERAIAVLERFVARSGLGDETLLRARLALARARGDGAALADAARSYLEHARSDRELVRAAATQLLAERQPVLASRLLSALPDGDRADLRLQALLALAENERVELLLVTTAPAQLGGPLRVAEAYLAIGQPERALQALAERAAADDGDPHQRALLQAQALLDMGQPTQAAALAARIPESSSHRPQALQTLALALEASGLPALASETQTVPQAHPTKVTSERSEPRGE